MLCDSDWVNMCGLFQILKTSSSLLHFFWERTPELSSGPRTSREGPVLNDVTLYNPVSLTCSEPCGLTCSSSSVCFSADWSMEALLHRWKMNCVEVRLETFAADKSELAGSSLPGSHSIDMMIITLKSGEDEQRHIIWCLPEQQRLSHLGQVTKKITAADVRRWRKCLYVYRETNMESFEEFYMFNKSMNWILTCCQSLKWCFITGTLTDTSQFLSVSRYKHSTCFCSESLNQDQNEIWSFLCWSLRVNVRRLTDSLKHLKAETLKKSSWASEVISLLKTLILTSLF